ncbi:MAG: hypothetical protein M1816_005750 [Peltula sp. TS41687]|nr:MAG: hypothetical protein M1816_005750 [Peltula sp. TS41687]
MPAEAFRKIPAVLPVRHEQIMQRSEIAPLGVYRGCMWLGHDHGIDTQQDVLVLKPLKNGDLVLSHFLHQQGAILTSENEVDALVEIAPVDGASLDVFDWVVPPFAVDLADDWGHVVLPFVIDLADDWGPYNRDHVIGSVQASPKGGEYGEENGETDGLVEGSDSSPKLGEQGEENSKTDCPAHVVDLFEAFDPSKRGEQEAELKGDHESPCSQLQYRTSPERFQ